MLVISLLVLSPNSATEPVQCARHNDTNIRFGGDSFRLFVGHFNCLSAQHTWKRHSNRADNRVKQDLTTTIYSRVDDHAAMII